MRVRRNIDREQMLLTTAAKSAIDDDRRATRSYTTATFTTQLRIPLVANYARPYRSRGKRHSKKTLLTPCEPLKINWRRRLAAYARGHIGGRRVFALI